MRTYRNKGYVDERIRELFKEHPDWLEQLEKNSKKWWACHPKARENRDKREQLQKLKEIINNINT